MPPKRKQALEEPETLPTKKVKLQTLSRAQSSHSQGWVQEDTLYMYHSGEQPRNKIAAFDMDHTLIKPKDNKAHPKGRNDWVWLYDDLIKKVLKEFYDKGYAIVLFTNQGGISKKITTPEDIKGKIEDLISDSGIPMSALIASNVDKYRKPHGTMWERFVTNLNGGVEIDTQESFYCGDAAGRVAGWKQGLKKDFSCVDRAFAHNIGLTFKTPEELFLNEAPTTQYALNCFDSTKYLKELQVKDYSKDLEPHTSLELVLMVGPPASGKSSISKKHFISQGYVHVNRDTLSTMAKCIKAAKEALAAQKSVIVDNTNPTKEARKGFIELAKQFKARVRCITLQIDKDLVQHLNLYREVLENVRRIPSVAYNRYYKVFQEPSIDEGIDVVAQIGFVPQFKTDLHKEFFLKQYPT